MHNLKSFKVIIVVCIFRSEYIRRLTISPSLFLGFKESLIGTQSEACFASLVIIREIPSILPSSWPQILNSTNMAMMCDDPHFKSQGRRKVWKSVMPVFFLVGIIPPPQCVEMGCYAGISWESKCNIEIDVCAHFYKILLVFEVPYQPRVKWLPGKS